MISGSRELSSLLPLALMTKQNNAVVRTGGGDRRVNVTSTVIRTDVQLIQGAFLGAVNLSNPEERTYLNGKQRKARSLSRLQSFQEPWGSSYKSGALR